MRGIASNVGRLALACCVIVIATGCASIRVTHHATGTPPPLCGAGASWGKTVFFWGVAWRADQKEAATREGLAASTLSEALRSNPCFETLAVSRTVDGRDALLATDDSIVTAARTAGAESAVVIRIEELGPNLMLYLSPILWQTQNEVVMRVRHLDGKGGTLKTDVSTRWTRGGPFTLLGANSLDADLRGALNAVFFGDSTPDN
jgi:hypothetical protein